MQFVETGSVNSGHALEQGQLIGDAGEYPTSAGSRFHRISWRFMQGMPVQKALVRYIPAIVYTSFITLLLSQLAGCAMTNIISERPFGGSEQAIEIGETTRSEMRGVLGVPFDQDVMGNWEVYRAETDGIRFAVIVPYSKSRMWAHYLLITYDAKGRVSGVASGKDYNSFVNRTYERGLTIYVGGYGYHTSTRTGFPSFDGGGKADDYWAGYLGSAQQHSGHQRLGVDAGALRCLCEAAKSGHPCAYIELGNYFSGDWEKPYGIGKYGDQYCPSPILSGKKSYLQRDKEIACIWYSMANDMVLPPLCRAAFTAEEIAKIEHLLVDWQPSQCERQLAPNVGGLHQCE